MKFGVREICDVVFRATKNGKIGSRYFYKGEPVIYFDSLKTSTLEGAATTVYAQGGRGNSRLVAWEGERTVTFTMEDALISPLGLAILTGAGIVDAEADDKTIKVHTTATVAAVTAADEGDKENGYALVTDDGGLTVYVTEKPETTSGAEIFIMPLKQGRILSEPIIGACTGTADDDGLYAITIATTNANEDEYSAEELGDIDPDAFLVDFYVAKDSGIQEITINAKDFAGTYYVEASTLFRDADGVDHPAEFIIPKAKIQSNFTFTMASSGDPSTFTFTLDAFPGYTRFDPTEEVFFKIQVLNEDGADGDEYRTSTNKA